MVCAPPSMGVLGLLVHEVFDTGVLLSAVSASLPVEHEPAPEPQRHSGREERDQILEHIKNLRRRVAGLN